MKDTGNNLQLGDGIQLASIGPVGRPWTTGRNIKLGIYTYYNCKCPSERKQTQLLLLLSYVWPDDGNFVGIFSTEIELGFLSIF